MTGSHPLSSLVGGVVHQRQLQQPPSVWLGWHCANRAATLPITITESERSVKRHYNIRTWLGSVTVAAVAILLAPAFARAGNTWDGGGANDNWNTAANWNPDGIPAYGTATFS